MANFNSPRKYTNEKKDRAFIDGAFFAMQGTLGKAFLKEADSQQ